MSTDEKLYDVCIVGAGFSGLVLAIKLARAGLLVCLVDLNRIVGRRILSTGNGRCNFTNSLMSADYFYSNYDLGFIKDNHTEILDFFKELGVYYKDLDGYFYPITNQAKTIREALENEVKRLDIQLFLDNRVTDINREADAFKITTNRTIIKARKVSISCGGLAAATLGSSKLGYKIGTKFGLKTTKLAPALVGLTSKDICLKELAGVRAGGKVTYKNYSCEGEIQFNKDGISGYPVMCISRFIGLDELDKKLSQIQIDFVPFLNEQELVIDIKKRFGHNHFNVLEALLGLCNEKAIEQVVSYSRIYSDTNVSKLDNQDIDNLVYNFKNFCISITGTKGFDHAQVTAGGIDLNDINIDTMEAHNTTGLYFTGEVLDVDGICGGYNLSWAFTSAQIAANHIIKVLQ